ncbi:MAG TPA: hypothetical protein VFS19_06625 [Planctomycetota bacterium]|nr:hypothetical protein [Planctomycetota bacterium]
MKLLAALVLVLVPLQDKNEAETLFRKMEEKILKAKTLRAKLAGEMKEKKFTITGEFLADEGSKVRIEIEGKGEEEVRKALVICDGKKLSFTAEAPVTFEVPETFGKLMRASLARGGFLSALEFADRESKAKTDPEEAYKVTGFKMEAREKVGDREAQAVSYTVTRKGRDAAATLWIDISTQLPLKRVLKVDTVTLTESYSDVRVDEKIDAAKFEIPKETK